MELLRRAVINEFDRFLNEDDVKWDFWDFAVFSEKKSRFKVLLKEKAYVPSLFVFRWILEHYSISLLDEYKGGYFENGILFRLSGNTSTLLKVERSFLNLLSHFLGVATMTRMAVDMASKINPDVRIAATRKTYPGLRLFEKLAVHLAGGDTHRFSLKDMVMLKDNHIKAYGSDPLGLIKKAREVAGFSKKVEVEVDGMDLLKKILSAPVDIIMLDNFTPGMVQKAVRLIRSESKDVVIEVSGGITLETLKEYLKTGVDVISMGSTIHSAPFINVSMEVE